MKFINKISWTRSRLAAAVGLIALAVFGSFLAFGNGELPALAARATSTVDPNQAAGLPELPKLIAASPPPSIVRMADIHTFQPDRPRFEIYEYEVETGDNPWSIAQKFGLQTETILWGNEAMSADAGNFTVGMTINILPTDGVLHTVSAEDDWDRIELLYGIPQAEIVAFQGNDFPEEPPYTLTPGQQLIVPNGRKQIVWLDPGPPVDPEKGRQSPGYYSGDLSVGGSGSFILPVSPLRVTQPFWEGHFGIDLGTEIYQAVWASDSGTVIFSGWSTVGYGNLVIIDHGNGYWTYYAHNENNLVSAGQGVGQGQVIAESGSTGKSTGPHVHFAIRREGGGFLDPTGFLGLGAQ
jgi:hypothetical protein